MANKKMPDLIVPSDKEAEGMLLTGKGVEKKDDLLGDFPVEYCNDDNPDSIQQKAPEFFSRALDLEQVWQLLTKNGEFELQKKVKPSAEHNRLRLAFWREYERALQLNCSMEVVNIYKGIVSKENFEQIIKGQPRVVAWILKQPTNYANMMEEALSFSMHRVREILEMPIYKLESREVPLNNGGKKIMQKRVPNVPVAKLILDTMKLLDLRVKGAVVQTVKQHVKTENTNKNLTANFSISGEMDRTPKSLADIDAQIKKLSQGLETDGKS